MRFKMKVTVITSLMGVLGFDENAQIVDTKFFKKNPNLIAKKLNLIDAGKLIPEITTLIKRLEKKGYTTFVFEKTAFAEAAKKQLDIKAEIAQPSVQGEKLRRSTERFAIELGFVHQSQEFRELTRETMVELTRLRVKRAGEKRDLMVAQAILSIDDLDRTVNLFFGRIREWYGLHFPELDRIVEKHETYSRMILNMGERKNFSLESLMNEGLSKSKALRITKTAENSMGAELDENDIEQIKILCKHILALFSLRQSLQNYADSTVAEVAPNVQALVGSMLAARLIALAGGLTQLAKMPASTIQILGAEKALFRALKTGARPPKHGAIFQYASIHDAKKWQRGKISRALAGKLAIAARTDAFSGRYIGESLKMGLERRISEIKEKYRKPPQLPREAKHKKQGLRKARWRRKKGKRHFVQKS
jgi:nucleolar protein 56